MLRFPKNKKEKGKIKLMTEFATGNLNWAFVSIFTSLKFEEDDLVNLSTCEVHRFYQTLRSLDARSSSYRI